MTKKLDKHRKEILMKFAKHPLSGEGISFMKIVNMKRKVQA